MPTQFSPVSAQCDAVYLSRAVVRTALIGLGLVAAILVTVFYLLHSPAPLANHHAGTAHFLATPTRTLSQSQLSCINRP